MTKNNKDSPSPSLSLYNQIQKFNQKNQNLSESSFAKELAKRLEAEENLKEQFNLLQILIDTIPNPIFYKNLRGLYLGCNKSFAQSVGLSRANIIGKSVYDLYPKKWADIYQCEDLKLFQYHGEQNFETRFRLNNGKLCDVVFNKATFLNTKGELAGLVGVITDVTELKKAQKLLKQNKKKYRLVVDNASEGIVVVQDAKIKFFNAKASKFIGYSQEEFLLTPYSNFIHPDDRQMVWNHYVKKTRGEACPKIYSLRVIKKNGKIKWVENSCVLIEWKGQPATLNFLTDITKQKQAEFELKQYSILESAIEKTRFIDRDIVYFINKDMKIIWASKAASRVYGVPLEKMINHKCHKIFWYKDHPCKGCPALQSGKTGQIEVTIIHQPVIKNIKKESFWEKYCIPLKSETNGNVSFALISRNITDRVKSEKALKESGKKLRFLTNRLLAAQEQERKRIAMGLHGELGQSLAVLKLNLNSITNYLQNDNNKELKKELKDIISYTDDIIENVRRLSRDLTPSVLEDLGLTGAIKWLIEGYAQKFHIITSYDFENIDSFFSDKSQINIYRIFQEIFNNIRKHAKTKSVTAFIKKKKNYVCCEVKDCGKGFDTKEIYQMHSTQRGLGLAALEERTKILGGYFKVISKKGQGTRIRFILPIYKN